MVGLAQGFSNDDVENAASDVSVSGVKGSAFDHTSAAPKQARDGAGVDKEQVIAQRQADLPLPEDPPTASDFNSADASTTAVGSGRVSDGMSQGEGDLRSPATTNSTEGTGRQVAGRGLPDDAVARDAKGKAGLEKTTGKDFEKPAGSD